MGCQNSETPELINIKFGMDDYVGDVTQHAKIPNNAPVVASQCMGEISLLHDF